MGKSQDLSGQNSLVGSVKPDNIVFMRGVSIVGSRCQELLDLPDLKAMVLDLR